MNKTLVVVSTIFGSIIILFLSYKLSEACTRSGPVIISHACEIAEYIVRATALVYSQPPTNPNLRTTGVPASKVAFRVEEILKGDSLGSPIEPNGYLTDKDDFNDHPVPYNFVRRNGRAGSCFANEYKQGAQYLLFLKSSSHVQWPGVTTSYTVDIDALAPVNEQLHSSDDPWVYYIKGLIAGLRQAKDRRNTIK